MADIAFKLRLLPGRFGVARLAPDARCPNWAGGSFLSVTRTATELSIVCADTYIPTNVDAERDWRCLQVAGNLDFTQVGVIASLAEPLRKAGIPIFVISTHDTDYLLVKAARLEDAKRTLTRAGHAIEAVADEPG